MNLSKKDVVPSITTVLFLSWVIIWFIALMLGWVLLDLVHIFFFLLPIPWILLIIVVWYNWKNIQAKILNPKMGKSHFDPLYIREGFIRLFLMVSVFIVFIYYIFLEYYNLVAIIPIGLLVVVNAILAYFGFKPSETLPKDYVIEILRTDIPSNKQLLISLPIVKHALNELEVRFKQTIDAIDRLVQKSNASVNEIIPKIEERVEDLDKIIKNMPYYSFTHDKFEKYNYILLVIVLAIINLIAQPAFNIPSYIALPTFSIFGILVGVSARGKINENITSSISDDLQSFKQELSNYRNNLKDIGEFSSEFRNDLDQLYEAFINSNFLEFLPSNYSSLLSIGFVSFLSLLVFILPLPVPEAIFTTLQWFVIYYFTTKQ